MRFSAVHCFSTDCTVALNLLIAMSWIVERVSTTIIRDDTVLILSRL